MFQRTIDRVFSLALCCAACFAGVASPAQAQLLKIGVAKLDITPKDLTGLVGIVPRPYGGVHDHLFVRALVLDNGATSAAIVALDLVEMGNTLPLRERVAKELGIPADHIIMSASHDHNAPRGGPVTAGTSSVQGRPYSPPAYIQQVDDTILAALTQAKSSMQPARFGYDTGNIDVNVQRYGYTPERGWRENPNEEGFSDKTLAVLKFTALSGEPLAVLFNYAVHSNSMTGEKSNLISQDISGNAEKFVEEQFKGKVVALWSMGAAADQYPRFNFDMGLLDANTSVYAPAEIQGSMIGGEVLKVMKRVTNTTESARIEVAERIVPCPMNVHLETPPQGNNPAAGGQGNQNALGGPGPSAPPPGPQRPSVPTMQLLPPPRPGDTLPIYLGLIRLNQVAIVGVSGEVGSQIFQHLKRESPFPDTIMITLSNDRAGYIPDDAGWDHMGNGAAFVRGCAEKTIVDNLSQMMKATLP